MCRSAKMWLCRIQYDFNESVFVCNPCRFVKYTAISLVASLHHQKYLLSLEGNNVEMLKLPTLTWICDCIKLENYWAKFLNFLNDGLPVDAPQPIYRVFKFCLRFSQYPNFWNILSKTCYRRNLLSYRYKLFTSIFL